MQEPRCSRPLAAEANEAGGDTRGPCPPVVRRLLGARGQEDVNGGEGPKDA